MKVKDVDSQKVVEFIDRQLESRKARVLILREELYDFITAGDDLAAGNRLDQIISELAVLNYLGEEKYMAEMAEKIKAELQKVADEAPQA